MRLHFAKNVHAVLLLSFLLCGVTELGCGGPQPCGPSTCMGCCDEAGTCRVGAEPRLCGRGGAACGSCLLGQVCQLGVCAVTSFGGSGAGVVGGGQGGGVAVAGGAGGSGGGVSGCDTRTCAGCCEAGRCEGGRSDSRCGLGGGACAACPGGQRCAPSGAGGVCVNAGGGSAGCGPQSCAGCCESGTCRAPSPASCGLGGAFCSVCPMGSACLGGVCQPCADGCVDPATGQCAPGDEVGRCGRGVTCVDCGASRCIDRRCVAQPTCSAATCTGCCHPVTGACIPSSQQSAQQCGQDAAGSQCTSCTGACDLQNNRCAPARPDAGRVPCSPTSPCGAGECCNGGVCLTIGSTFLSFFSVCGRSGGTCDLCSVLPGGATTCNRTLGVCQ